MHFAVTRAQFPRDEQVAAYYDRLAARIQALSEVLSWHTHPQTFCRLMALGNIIRHGLPG